MIKTDIKVILVKTNDNFEYYSTSSFTLINISVFVLIILKINICLIYIKLWSSRSFWFLPYFLPHPSQLSLLFPNLMTQPQLLKPPTPKTISHNIKNYLAICVAPFLK